MRRLARTRLSRRSLITTGLAWTSSIRPAQAAETPLRNLAAQRGLIYGCAVEPENLDQDQAFEALAVRQCASLSAENVLKWDTLRPGPDLFDFRRADRLLAIARRQKLDVHGHCLVWHEALPAWVKNDLNSATAERLLTDHIQTVVGRYAGQIQTWDVLNEVVERNDRRRDGLRLSPWFEALGPDYLSLALRLAHHADPHARLLLCDYGLEYDDERWMVEKRATMLGLLHDLKASGAPIHGLGLQAHLYAHRPPAFGPAFRRFLAEVADIGLEIHITELDVDDQHLLGSPSRRDQDIARIYRTFLSTALDEVAVKSITTWGLSDRYTSKASLFARADGQPVRPLPFDAQLRAKPAAYAVMRALSAAPRRPNRRLRVWPR